MPKRWLSRRGRPQQTESSVHPTAFSTKDDFDFAFADSPTSFPTALPPVTALPSQPSKEERPTIAASAVDGRSRKKLKIDINLRRPRTSEGNRASVFNPSHRASRSVDDLIGLAFGSPSHPPMAFGNLAAPLSPIRLEPGYQIRGLSNATEKGPHLQPKKWKKIGALFRGRSAFAKTKDSSAAASPAMIQNEEKHNNPDANSMSLRPKTKPDIPEEPCRCPPPVPMESEIQDPEKEPLADKSVLDLDSTPPSSAEIVGPPRKLVERPTRMSSLPKLEVDIPNRPLDRYTVMMRNIPAASRSSSLLARRSKALDSLTTSGESSRNASTSDDEKMKGITKPISEGGEAILQPRRMTSPTMPKPPFAVTTATSSPTVSKYSLFPPASPAPIKIIGRVPFESPLKRSATSPARLSPMQDHFPLSKAEPLNAKRNVSNENPLSSPEDNTASTERTEIWSTNHSLNSSVSSSTTIEEIYFDIKSFRDSRGIEDGKQFVINRPDSAVVQLARTRSKLNAATRSHKPGDEKDTPGSRHVISSLRKPIPDKHSSVSSVNTAVFDEVIAAVEEFALPTSSREKRDGSNGRNGDSNGSMPTNPSVPKASLDMKLLPPDPVLPVRTSSKRQHDYLARTTIPSPVPEEVSPSSKKSLTLSPEKLSNPRAPSPASTITEKPKEIPSADPQAASKLKDSSKSDETPSKPKEPSKLKDASSQPSDPVTKAAESSKLKESPSKPAPIAAVASLKRVDTPIEDSPTIPQGPPPRKPVRIVQEKDERPPPVPEKDAKFIPISKFAAKKTIAKVERAGVRPARPVRAATDTAISTSPQIHQHRHGIKLAGRAERSATVPNPQSQQGSTSMVRGMNSNSAGEGEATTGPTVVRATPTAEVSVARTVSLSRKQSARVLVPGPKLAARRAAERSKEGGEAGSGADTPVTVISAANSPAVGSDSPRVPQEQVQAQTRPKVVEIHQAKEATARVNPLRSHPSPPSVAITDVPVVIAMAGTATPASLTQAKAKSTATAPPEDPDKEKARERVRLLKEQAREKIARDAQRVESSRVKEDDEERMMIERHKERDKTKWDVLEKRALSPVVVEGNAGYGHKMGLSVSGLVVEGA